MCYALIDMFRMPAVDQKRADLLKTERGSSGIPEASGQYFRSYWNLNASKPSFTCHSKMVNAL